jgi:hypothetical protein
MKKGLSTFLTIIAFLMKLIAVLAFVLLVAGIYSSVTGTQIKLNPNSMALPTESTILIYESIFAIGLFTASILFQFLSNKITKIEEEQKNKNKQVGEEINNQEIQH